MLRLLQLQYQKNLWSKTYGVQGYETGARRMRESAKGLSKMEYDTVAFYISAGIVLMLSWRQGMCTSCVVGSCDWDLQEHTGMFVWKKVTAEVSGQQIWNMSFVIWADNTDKSILCHPLFGVGVILSSRKGSWGRETVRVSCWWRLSGWLPVRFCFHPGTHFGHPIGGQIAGPWFSFSFPLSLQHNPHFGQIDDLKPPPTWTPPPWQNLISYSVFSYFTKCWAPCPESKSHTGAK